MDKLTERVLFALLEPNTKKNPDLPMVQFYLCIDIFPQLLFELWVSLHAVKIRLKPGSWNISIDGDDGA